MWAIQSFKHGGPVSLVHKGFAGSLALVLAPTLFHIFRVRRCIAHSGSPTTFADRFTLQTHLIEASLIGLAYYLFMIMCQLHAHVCGVAVLRKELELLKRQAAETSLGASGLPNHGSLLGKEEEIMAYCQKIDALETLVLDLRKKIEELEMECKAKDEEIRAAEANTKALQKQSEGFLLEYDRLLEDNQALRGQLSVVDKKLLHSDSNRKKS